MGYVTKEHPIGVDCIINSLNESIYESLKESGWENYDAYHRCYKTPINSSEYIPEAFTEVSNKRNGEYQDVLMQTGLNTSFFITGNTTTPISGLYMMPISIIFQVNCEELYFNVVSHRADEEARNDAIVAVQNSSFGNDITAIHQDINQVYAEFSKESIKFDDMNPYHVFRIDLNVSVDYCSSHKNKYPNTENQGFNYVGESGLN